MLRLLRNKIDYFSDRPITLANLGLTYFKDQLKEEQRNWCIDAIWKAAIFILNEARHRSHEPEKHYNLHEKPIVLQSIHLVIPYAGQEDIPDIIAFMICLGNAHMADYEMDRFTPYFRTTFYAHFPEMAKKVWMGLIELAHFKKENPRQPYLDQEAVSALMFKEEEFIKSIAKGTAFELKFEELNFTTYDAHILSEVLFMTPFDQSADQDFSNLATRFVELLTPDLHLKVNHGYNHHPESRKILHQAVSRIVHYLAQLLMVAEEKVVCRLIDLVVDPVLTGDYKLLFHRDSGLLDFCKRVPEQFLWALDQATYYNDHPEQNQKLIDRFWMVWRHLFSRVKPVGGSVFAKFLLLEVGWKEEATDWKPLGGQQDFYHEMVRAIGIGRTKSIVKCLSTIGSVFCCQLV